LDSEALLQAVHLFCGVLLAESEFVKSEKSGYSYGQRKITYGDIEQRKHKLQ
jgi:hypothetical protein